jgi:hypothetical protein
MFTRVLLAALLAIILTGGAASAQLFSAEVTPNPVAQGSGISIKMECTVTAWLKTGCGYTAIYKDKPGGALVYQPLICPRIIRIVGPGQGFTTQWNCQVNNQPIAPGNYLVRIDWATSQAGPYSAHYVPFRVDAQIPNTLPLLAASNRATRGQTLGLTVNSANQPNAGYVLAASFTTNKGFQLAPSVWIDLDQDALFWTSLAIPNGPIFQNFVGVLDRTGIAKASVAIPSASVLLGAQISLQGVTVQGSILQATNALTGVIL